MLAKRKANFIDFNGQQTLMQMLDCAFCKLLQPVYERFNLMWCRNDISKLINQHIPLPTNICDNPFARRSATFRFFGLFLFATLRLTLPILLYFLIRRFLLRRSASFYVSRF